MPALQEVARPSPCRGALKGSLRPRLLIAPLAVSCFEASYDWGYGVLKNWADWAIVKHDGHALYLVRETKATRDFLKLRASEADKVRCGIKHFEAIEVPFAVVVSADEV